MVVVVVVSVAAPKRRGGRILVICLLCLLCLGIDGREEIYYDCGLYYFFT